GHAVGPGGRRRQRRPALVQGRGDLPDPREGVPRRRRRRLRGLPRAHGQAGLHPVAGRHLRLAAPVLPVAAQGRRLRHRRLRGDQPHLRDDQGLPRLPRRGAPARAARDHRARDQPHLRPAPLVPARAQRAQGELGARLLRVERRPQQVRGHAHHLHRHREVELGVGPGGGAVLLAPLLQPPARPQLRQPEGAGGDHQRDALLAAHGRRRAAPRRDPVPRGARGDELREPPRDARRAQADARGDGRRVPGARLPRRGQPVAARRAPVLRRRRRVPHGVPLPADAADVHGAAARGPHADRRDHGPHAGDPRELPVGHLPPQPRRAHARDGDGRRARLHVHGVRARQAHAHQRGDPPPPRAAHGQRPPPGGADERAAHVDAGHADHLLRRRDRDGRQRVPGRPQRRAHPDAVERVVERGLLRGRLRRALQPAHRRPAVRLPGAQRDGAGAHADVAPAVDAPPRRGAPAPQGVRPRHAGVPAPREHQGARVPPQLRGRHHPLRELPVALRPARRARPLALRRDGAGGALERAAVPADRRAAVLLHDGALRVLLVQAHRARRRGGRDV
ncbi:MAG: GH13_16 / GH13_36 / GH13_4 / GH13_23 / GH13_ 17 / GH13 / GH13_31 / GH13_40 / GH13_29 / GH13_35 / G H13_30 / GH13_20 / GH13_2 / GH13_34 / GH13_18 / GH1 3_1 / GH13_21 / GH13_19 / GH13_10 / GH13_37, partial [uncultured Gemmatimonadaceae bacterium]